MDMHKNMHKNNNNLATTGGGGLNRKDLSFLQKGSLIVYRKSKTINDAVLWIFEIDGKIML